MRTIVAEDALGQVLVILYESGRVDVARRTKPHYSWGEPLKIIEDTTPLLHGWKDDVR